jgi:hypothetical protein
LPLACQHKIRFGGQSCVTDCPATGPAGVFEYVKVLAPEDVPRFDPRIVDVAVLDMNHGWPNLGHDSLIHAVQDAACDLLVSRPEAGLRVRALSYDVRRNLQVPEPPGDRFSLYLGTGGPGHIDPERNDGTSEGSQGVKEDPSWQAPDTSTPGRTMGSRNGVRVSARIPPGRSPRSGCSTRLRPTRARPCSGSATPSG